MPHHLKNPGVTEKSVHFPQKGQQAFVGTLTEAGQQGAVVFEIDTQQRQRVSLTLMGNARTGNTEDVLLVRFFHCYK